MGNVRTREDFDLRLKALEARLAGALQPVSPSQELLQRLRGRIRLPEAREIVDRLREWQTLLLVLGGVLAAAIAVITVARAMYHLVGRRKPV